MTTSEPARPTTDFVARHKELLAGIRQLYRAAPRTMAGFGSMHKGAVEDGALTRGTKR